ncbi:metalloendopeptidase activity protein [Homalodisca vitripennis]|nr:metalloendopeptidase activity protein [Homalodisca vitripennis]
MSLLGPTHFWDSSSGPLETSVHLNQFLFCTNRLYVLSWSTSPLFGPPYQLNDVKNLRRTHERFIRKLAIRLAIPFEPILWKRWRSLLAYDVLQPVLQQSERKRRSSDPAQTLVLEAPKLARNFTLQLSPSADLLDPRFVLLSRREGHSEPLSLDLVERDCAVTSSRGLIKPPGDEYYVINPLPKRFSKRSSDPPHIIVRKHLSHLHADNTSSTVDNTSVCGVRAEADSPSSDTWRLRRSVGGPVHVETAVFVDSDMFHLMSNNFPVDTEREVVRFVLALVNAASRHDLAVVMYDTQRICVSVFD